jgi:hypothetical protein
MTRRPSTEVQADSAFAVRSCQMTRRLGWGALSLVVLGAACGSGGSAHPPADGGPDVDSGGPVVAAPDLRFKWVGAGLKLHFAGWEEGRPAPNVGTITGPYGATPFDLSGDWSPDSFRIFSAPDLEPMIVTQKSGEVPDIVPDLDQLVDARTIVVSLDTSFDKSVLSNPDGFYFAALSASQGGVLYQPYVRGTTTAAGLADWLATQLSPGEVATALGPTADGLFVTAFGRAGDSTSYETQVVTATLDDLCPSWRGWPRRAT